MASTTKRTVFPASQAGKHLASLFIASCVFGTISFGLSMSRFGGSSFFLNHAAFALTFVHHVTVRCLVVKKHASMTDANSPAETRFRCLRHIASISLLVIFALIWFTGSMLTIIGHTEDLFESWPDRSKLPSTDVIVDLTSAAVAIIESGILIAIAVFCWKLRREANLERSQVASLEQVSVVK
jgi:hypothetical protein